MTDGTNGYAAWRAEKHAETMARGRTPVSAGLADMGAHPHAGPQRPDAPSMIALVDYVKRKGPVETRDVAARFGLAMATALSRVERAEQWCLIEAVAGGWRVRG